MNGILRRPHGLIFCIFLAFCCVAQITSQARAASEGSKNENWRRIGESVIHEGNNPPTKVTVVGNRVLVPVTLVYRGNQADVQLLLDTGASGTAINTEIAEQLGINVNSAKKIRIQVVGGQVIEARVAMLDSLAFGPHTKTYANITIIPHTGPQVRHDGLLGMDVLRRLQYRVDLDRRLILWE